MFKKILIANRGEIACRVAATSRRMGIKTVAVYSDADVKAKHVLACDEAIHIGGADPKDSYLQWSRILDAAKGTGAEAIHPGYGFLSENAAFARACDAAGIVFIGPSPEAIEAMGLKAQSKRLMADAGVPLVPGYHGDDQSPEHLRKQADAIGYPVLIKASAGGGGKGMRIVESGEHFFEALQACQREAINSFANDDVLIEKYVQRPRHIEIQVFGDTHGHLVHLFERDCSVQRRHQKVLEESPAPGLTPQMRTAMGDAALAAARAVNYVGAGTVEFIVEQKPNGEMAFFFMEMNTRLQVEHPVTEAVTGIDLVAWQLLVASGAPLPCEQADIQMNGHAIEARICAENPSQQFLPATGTLTRLALPECQSFAVGAVRWDSGVTEGDAISPFYDSMIAKLIVHADNRDQALAKLNQALAETHVVGLHHNVGFLRSVINTPSFTTPMLDTALITRESAALFQPVNVSPAWCIAAALVAQVSAEQEQSGAHPWLAVDGWQVIGAPARRLQLVSPHAMTVRFRVGTQPGHLAFEDGMTHTVQWRHISEDRWSVTLDGARQTLRLVAGEAVLTAFFDAGAVEISVHDPLRASVTSDHAAGSLAAPMPGKVVAFNVAVGDVVQAGAVLAVMEAMKMEHTILAPTSGTVAALFFEPGEQVAEGEPLLQLEGDAP